MTHTPTDSDDFLTAMKETVKPLERHDKYVSGVAKKPLVIDLPRRARASDQVGHDRAVHHVGGREMDRNMAARVRAGKVTIEARIDLHGDTIDQARARVISFVTGAVDRGYRCILVITGKGTYNTPPDENAPNTAQGDPWTATRRGRIRAAFPGWMSEPPLDRLVLMIAPAKPADGGSGAFYVYLRQVRTP